MLKFFNFFKKEQSIIGLDISDNSAKLLSLQKDKKEQLSTRTFTYLTLEEGTVDNGNILDEKKLTNILKDAFKEISLSNYRAILALPESKAFLDLYSIDSSLKGVALKNKLIELAGKNIPFEPENTYFDYKEVGFDKKNNKKLFLYIASPKETVDKYLKVCQQAGLEILAVEGESLSLKRSLVGYQDDKESVLLLDMGARTINLSIAYQNDIYLSSVILKGGNQLTKKIADEMKLSFEEADRLKISRGVRKESKQDKISKILEDFCDPVIQEIQEQITFYFKQTNRKIDRVIVCGGSSLMTGVDNRLQEKLELKVERINPWKKHQIAITSENGKIYLEKEDPLLYATVIGLALRGLQLKPYQADLNLLKYKGR
jgi:type IV pilus assembly protein PilM